LASPMASWVTGQNLVVDGSFTHRIGYLDAARLRTGPA
jgi:NAD(P)-dependent dehydrogenase (short-subunit alcohol dehydrogenase family)